LKFKNRMAPAVKREGEEGLGQGAMTTRTHFAFRIDMWSPDGSSIIEHIAGVEDFQVAQATYRAAVERWPGGVITLRQGARVIEDSRRSRFAAWAGRAGGDSRPTPMANRASRRHHRRGGWALG
jgi:hypothetical protein